MNRSIFYKAKGCDTINIIIWEKGCDLKSRFIRYIQKVQSLMCKCKDFFFLYDRFIHSRSLHYEVYTYDLVYHLRSWIYFRFYGWITKFDNKNTTKITVDIKINLKYLILQLVPVDSKPRPLRYKSQTINRTPILTSDAVIFISFR